MIFTDISYFVFLAIVITLYRYAGKARPWVVIASGAAFYAYYATGFLWLFALEAALIYYLTHRHSHWIKVCAVLLPLLLLGYYKYAGFFYSIFASSNNPFIHLALPLAISF